MSETIITHQVKVAKPSELLEYVDWAGVIRLIEDHEAATRVERMLNQRRCLEAE